MNFCLNVWLKKIDIENDNDLANLYDLFDDETLFNFIRDNQYAEHLYFIMEDKENIIGFLYLIRLKNSKIYNVRYGIKKEKLNYDYVYTTLTRVRDKLKGYDEQDKLTDSIIITGLKKYDRRYNEVASKFGRRIYETDDANYYEINPNCEHLDNEVKVLKYYLGNRAV